MACEVVAVQEPQMQLPMQTIQTLQSQEMAMAQPYVVAMLVPAALMMPGMPSQVSPVNQGEFTQNTQTWPQDMQWPANLPNQQMVNFNQAPMESFQAPGAPDYDYNGYDGDRWDDQRNRRRRRTRLQPKAPGMLAREEHAMLSQDYCSKLREQLEESTERASEVAKMEILGSVWPYSLHPTGCRLVQLAIQSATPAVGKAIALELHGHVREAAESPHANYVLQKVIEQLSASTSAFIGQELLPSVQRFARHRFGCRIVCRLVEHCSLEESTMRLIEKLLEDPDEAIDLCRHNFGHHVVQCVLEHGHARHKEAIAEVLRHDLLANASHRSASYVVETALLHCSTEDQDSLVQFLVQPAVVADLAQADFGVFVVRTLLKHAKVDAQVLIQTVPAVAALSSEFA